MYVCMYVCKQCPKLGFSTCPENKPNIDRNYSLCQDTLSEQLEF